MASMRSALRLAQRAQCVRPATTTSSRVLPLAQQQQQQQRTFMFDSRPAKNKPTEEAEEGSEDLAGGNEDPNMVCPALRSRRGTGERGG